MGEEESHRSVSLNVTPCEMIMYAQQMPKTDIRSAKTKFKIPPSSAMKYADAVSPKAIRHPKLMQSDLIMNSCIFLLITLSYAAPLGGSNTSGRNCSAGMPVNSDNSLHRSAGTRRLDQRESVDLLTPIWAAIDARLWPRFLRDFCKSTFFIGV